MASLYDLDVTLPDPEPGATFSRQPDAMLDALRAPLTAAMLELYATRLGWRVEAQYALLSDSVNRAWEWGGWMRRSLGITPTGKTVLKTSLARWKKNFRPKTTRMGLMISGRKMNW